MSNDYFTEPSTPIDFTTARASVIRAVWGAIVAAFDKLPSLLSLRQMRWNYVTAGGTANALTATIDPAVPGYVEGATFKVKAIALNTGPTTLNVNGLGSVGVVDMAGSALVGGEIVAGRVYEFIHDGTHFQLSGTGQPGPKGDTGSIGPPDANTVWNGSGVPGGGLGQDGDFYINTAAWTIYGPKTAGAWGAAVPLQGSDGADGTDGADGIMVLTGHGAPGGGTGINGDVYFDLDTPGAFYGPKAAGAWPALISLKGDQGDQGDQGDAGVVDTTANYNFTNALGIALNGIEAGFRGLPISRSVAANFTLDNDDRGKCIVYTDTGDTCTVPLNTTEAILVGEIITICHDGTGPLTIAREAGVTMKLVGTGANANRTLPVGGFAWLWKRSTNTWFVGGDIT